jgi:hypothetical protein
MLSSPSVLDEVCFTSTRRIAGSVGGETAEGI